MRIVTNEVRIKRNRNFATILFFFSLAVLLAGLVINTLTATSSLFLVVPCLIMPIGLFSTLLSVRLTNTYIRLPRPEDAIKEATKGANKRAILYNYLPIADHVLLTPQGVYTFLPLFQARAFSVNGSKWDDSKAKGPLGPFMLFMKQENLGDPFKAAHKASDAVDTLLKDVLPGIDLDVQPVVVMISEKAKLELTDPELPVGFADIKKRPSIKSMLRDDKKREDAYDLTDEQIAKLDAVLRKTVGKPETLVEVEES